MPSDEVLGLLIAAGLFGGLAHIATALSLKLAEASAIAPFEYLTLIWAVLTDLLLFGTAVGPAFMVAVPVLLIGAGVATRGRGGEDDLDAARLHDRRSLSLK